MKLQRLSLMLMLVSVALAASAGSASGSWDDDDDIYYNPSKDTSRQSTPATTYQQAAQRAASNYVPNTVVNYPSADTYQSTVGSGLNMDVDAYNRRGQFLVQDSIAAVPQSTADTDDSFACTRRIERFYNSDIVNASGDSQLIDYYYADPATTTSVNVYVVDPWAYTYSPWTYSYYNNPWYWSSSFYWNTWGWTWGVYDPWYSWSWGWGPGYCDWGWGWPHHHHYPDYHPGGWGHDYGHWSSSPGASRPHASTNGNGGAVTSNRRPGAISAGASSFNRPGNMGQSTGNRRGNTTNGTRPATNFNNNFNGSGNFNSGSGNSVNMNRGRGNSGSNNNRSSNYNNTNNRRSNSNSYNYNNSNSNSSRGRSSSGSSFGGGGRSTHSGGGGSHSGGGGGGRGRR